MAARHGRMDVFRLLLEKGSDKNAKTKGGGTVLRMAAGNGLVEVVRLLLDASNTDKDVQDEVPWPCSPACLHCVCGALAFTFSHCVLRRHAAGWLDADLLGGAQRAHGGGEPAAAARGKQGIAEQRRQDAAGCGEGAGHARRARDRLSKQAASCKRVCEAAPHVTHHQNLCGVRSAFVKRRAHRRCSPRTQHTPRVCVQLFAQRGSSSCCWPARLHRHSAAPLCPP